MSIALELARLADAPVLAGMSSRLIEAGLAPSWPAERIARHIRHPENVVLTGRHAGQIAGFAIMHFADVSAHLNLLAVESGAQRRGLGRTLLRWLEASASTAGIFLIRLELRAGNLGARAFYEALGYRETGRVAGYYQRLEDAIQMAHDLRVGHGAGVKRN
ncbi:MAG TPA: GNAT family N-acetyltransferase [Steroidobacteraceae bacterium]|nr:GNAT family N-acetyltransferase [Steroidobacteraceae bacterium]